MRPAFMLQADPRFPAPRAAPVAVRDADMMENDVAKNFGRVSNHIRAALAPQQSPETKTRNP